MSAWCQCKYCAAYRARTRGGVGCIEIRSYTGRLSWKDLDAVFRRLRHNLSDSSIVADGTRRVRRILNMNGIEWRRKARLAK